MMRKCSAKEAHMFGLWPVAVGWLAVRLARSLSGSEALNSDGDPVPPLPK
jgi:hypothetical protein